MDIEALEIDQYNKYGNEQVEDHELENIRAGQVAEEVN
jgi:hypothetical protein